MYSAFIISAWGSKQAQLLDSLFGTERGLSASSEVRAEINELITQLEAENPNPSLPEVRISISKTETPGFAPMYSASHPWHVQEYVDRPADGRLDPVQCMIL